MHRADTLGLNLNTRHVYSLASGDFRGSETRHYPVVVHCYRACSERSRACPFLIVATRSQPHLPHLTLNTKTQTNAPSTLSCDCCCLCVHLFVGQFTNSCASGALTLLLLQNPWICVDGSASLILPSAIASHLLKSSLLGSSAGLD